MDFFVFDVLIKNVQEKDKDVERVFQSQNSEMFHEETRLFISSDLCCTSSLV